MRDLWRPYLDLHPDDPFWIDDAGVLARGELGRAVDARARELARTGGSPGQRHPLEPHPTRQTVVDLLGALAAGATAVLLPLREPPARRRALAAGATAEDGAPGQIWVRTSGSGGQPRWVIHLAETLMAGAEAAATRVAFGRGSAWRLSLPLDHVGGLSLIWRALVGGGALLAGGDPARETHRSLVPTQLHRALAAGEEASLRHLRCLLLGGAPLPPTLRRRALAAGMPLRVSYGLTETGALVAASLPGDALCGEADYAGRPLWPGRVAVDDDGLVRVSAPSLAVGRADDTGAMAPLDLDAGGLLPTHDLGRLEGDALYVTGRRGNVIVSGGEKLAAEELEGALLGLPGVLAAVVVPLDDAEFGQRPVAFLATTDQARWPADAVREALADQVARWKLPRHVLPLPDGAGLKADRAALRRLAADLLA
jgi:O-succinylbenzoic acid--CoA ligase